jgi:hypothetical protein
MYPCAFARARDEIVRLTALLNDPEADPVGRARIAAYAAAADAAEAKVAMLTEAARKFLDAIPGALGSVTSPAEVERVHFRVALGSSSAAEWLATRDARIEREAVERADAQLEIKRLGMLPNMATDHFLEAIRWYRSALLDSSKGKAHDAI